MSVFFGMYSFLWLLVTGLSIFLFFISIPAFIPLIIIFVWMCAEWLNDNAILIYGKHKDIMQNEFMSVNKESVKEAELLGNLDKKHHK